jgi:hypothetical protein
MTRPPHGKAPSSIISSRPLAAGSSQTTWGKFNRHICGVSTRRSHGRRKVLGVGLRHQRLIGPKFVLLLAALPAGQAQQRPSGPTRRTHRQLRRWLRQSAADPVTRSSDNADGKLMTRLGLEVNTTRPRPGSRVCPRNSLTSGCTTVASTQGCASVRSESGSNSQVQSPMPDDMSLRAPIHWHPLLDR